MEVVAYVLGLNPNVKLFEGYCHRLWGKNNVDKVIPIKKGIFLIRFLNTESKTKALQMHNLMLDNRPVFFKQWHDGSLGCSGSCLGATSCSSHLGSELFV